MKAHMKSPVNSSYFSTWIVIRDRLEEHPKTVWLAAAFGRSPSCIAFDLYRLAGWFGRHGDYGKIDCDLAIVDAYLGVPGLAAGMERVGWLASCGGVLVLREFCAVSARRKSIGKKIRSQVLGAGECAACGSTTDLEIDHIIPIALGGACDIKNFQVLCRTCNRIKGKNLLPIRGVI